ncbi:MAG: NBR1-Ig-like domain-containing protein [Anaerolineales bacterium]
MSRKLIFGILFAVMIAILLAGCGPINQRLLDGTAVAGGQSVGTNLTEPQGGEVTPVEPTVDTNALATQIQADLETAQPTATRTSAPTDTVMPTPQIPTDTPAPTLTPTKSEDELKLTALAETLIALASGTPTVEPAETQSETPAGDATATATPDGPTSTPGPTQVPCLAMRFVAHVTYPPYTLVQPNTNFYKTWYVQNVGSCTWNGEYAIVHYDGLQMNGPTPQRLGANVAVPPGDFVNITISLWTGPQTGEFSSYWMMSDDNGNLFGGGPNNNEPLVVIVRVPGDSPPVFTQPAVTAPPFYTPTP